MKNTFKLGEFNLVLGTYFLSELLTAFDLKGFDKLAEKVNENPLKSLAVMVQTAINTTNELNDEPKRYNLAQTHALIDENNWFLNGKLTEFSEAVAKSLGNDPAPKPTPNPKARLKK